MPRKHSARTVLFAAAFFVAGCSSPGDTTAITPKVATNAPLIAISAVGGNQVNPTTPIVVTASRGKLSSVTVTNPAGKVVTGTMSAEGLRWQSNEDLGYDTNYAVDATAIGPAGETSEQHQIIHTLAPKAVAYPELTPVPGTGVTFGVGEPIVVRFDQPVTDRVTAQRALQLSTTPRQDGGWYWVSDREVHYRPKNYWIPGTRVSLRVKIYGVNLGNGVYGKTDRSLDFSIHDSWIAKADGATEQMQILHNGQLVSTMPISMGKDSTPTHTGPHVISDKQQQVVMDSCTYGVCPPDPNAYHDTEFWAERISQDGEFVHENPASVAQQGSSNVSHGCVNLDQNSAMWFFQNFGLGDVVEVTNSGGPPLPISDTFGDWEIPWSQWQAGSAM